MLHKNVPLPHVSMLNPDAHCFHFIDQSAGVCKRPSFSRSTTQTWKKLHLNDIKCPTSHEQLQLLLYKRICIQAGYWTCFRDFKINPALWPIREYSVALYDFCKLLANLAEHSATFKFALTALSNEYWEFCMWITRGSQKQSAAAYSTWRAMRTLSWLAKLGTNTHRSLIRPVIRWSTRMSFFEKSAGDLLCSSTH